MSEKYPDSDKSVVHRFDYYIKKCIMHRTWNAFRDYRNQCKRILEIPWDDYLDNTIGRHDQYPSDEVTVQVGEFLVDFYNPKLNEMLTKLPKRIQTVVILYIVYEMSYEEIAEKLNVSHSTVRDYKSRGICLLRKYLKESGNEKRERKDIS